MIVVNMYKLRVANMKCEKERERESKIVLSYAFL